MIKKKAASRIRLQITKSCDLLKIHYLCGRNDNSFSEMVKRCYVVICSKFITFVVEMTTLRRAYKQLEEL